MTLEEFKTFSKQIGNYWFSAETLSFFESRIHDFDEDNGLFISSECGPFGHGPRMFTLRKADFQTGRVSTVGEFQKFKTLSEARTAFKKVIIAA